MKIVSFSVVVVQLQKLCNYLVPSYSTMKVLQSMLFVETAISDQGFKVLRSGPTSMEVWLEEETH